MRRSAFASSCIQTCSARLRGDDISGLLGFECPCGRGHAPGALRSLDTYTLGLVRPVCSQERFPVDLLYVST